MVKTSLKIAHQWRWNEQLASLLVEDLKQYYHCKGAFVGGQADGLDRWKSLLISSKSHPLKSLIITLLSIVPHFADVERLFLALGSTQTPKQCNLSIETFEMLGKLCANYSYHLYRCDRTAGKSTHCHHNHMHTCSTRGINVKLTEEIKSTFSYIPPLVVSSKTSDDFFDHPEDFSLDELKKEFVEFEKQLKEHPLPDADGTEVLDSEVYDFGELDWVNQGAVPVREDIEVIVVDGTVTQATWNVERLMSTKGIAV